MRGFNSTIQRRKKKCSSCEKMEYLFSHGLCQQCAKILSSKLLDKREKEQEDTESVAILKKDVDILFSKVVRLRVADRIGICTCYICGIFEYWIHMQAMHYVHREDSSLRYHFKNVRCGCKKCNEYLDGNLAEYAKKLDAEEPNLSEWLYLEGKQPYKFTRDELKQMIADFSREIRLLQNKLPK